MSTGDALLMTPAKSNVRSASAGNTLEGVLTPSRLDANAPSTTTVLENGMGTSLCALGGCAASYRRTQKRAMIQMRNKPAASQQPICCSAATYAFEWGRVGSDELVPGRGRERPMSAVSRSRNRLREGGLRRTGDAIAPVADGCCRGRSPRRRRAD